MTFEMIDLWFIHHCWVLACAFFVQIILGSSSIARRKILAEMGYEFTIVVFLLSASY